MSDDVPSVDRWGRPLVSAPVDGWFRRAYHNWFRVEWEGLEHIPPDGGALLVSNHAGLMPVDGGIISYGVEQETGRKVYSLAHDGFWRYPFVASSIARGGGVVGHPDNADRLLREDRSLVLVFPEGAKGPVKPPKERYRLQRFGRGGFVETAMRGGVPVVTIALMGTEDTTPTVATFQIAGQDVPLTLNTLLLGPLLGPFAPLPAKIRARVLPPVHFDEPAGLERYSRALLMDHAEDIRGQLQDALQGMLGERKSIWSG